MESRKLFMKPRHGRVHATRQELSLAKELSSLLVTKNGLRSCVSLLYDPCQRRCHNCVPRLSIHSQWGKLFFEGAFLFSKWMLQPILSLKFAFFQTPNHCRIHRSRSSLEYETSMKGINLILVCNTMWILVCWHLSKLSL